MRRVILESPYAGNVLANLAYGRRALAHSLSLGEAPIASHLLYTQPGVLDDAKSEERRQGILAGLSWLTQADATVVYTDLGVSAGMQQGIDFATVLGKPIEYRKIFKKTCIKCGTYVPTDDCAYFERVGCEHEWKLM